MKMYKTVILFYVGVGEYGAEENVRTHCQGDWRKLHKEELHDLYATPYYKGDEIKEDEMGGACGTYGGQDRYIQDFRGET